MDVYYNIILWICIVRCDRCNYGEGDRCFFLQGPSSPVKGDLYCNVLICVDLCKVWSPVKGERRVVASKEPPAINLAQMPLDGNW